MIDVLIAGKVHGTPTQRTGKSGKPFALAKVRTPTTEGESVFVSVIAFDDGPVAALLALKEGDSVAVAGPLKVGTWQDKEGQYRPALDVVAQQVLTVYQVRHKRAATQGDAQPQSQRPKDEAWRARAQSEPPPWPDDGPMPF
ncbi:single-stranded DNA-binding protein [Giesbergeria anulus]|uniref:Single-stranded DNA-binding protein n=1 Tax=Giesbergeria anulus TaxID=180197 RepID=A0A1H9G4V3_9BURK|nr:single-stranded DNA-binding protein [Giesbergeria anulus]SEQ44798.1 Single-strand binding protein family protein [Giesbergeria anulus]